MAHRTAARKGAMGRDVAVRDGSISEIDPSEWLQAIRDRHARSDAPPLPLPRLRRVTFATGAGEPRRASYMGHASGTRQVSAASPAREDRPAPAGQLDENPLTFPDPRAARGE